MPKDDVVERYLNMKKVTSMRMRTRLAEEAGERIMRQFVPSDVIFEEHNYMGDSDSFHDCDFIYKADNEDERDKKPLIIYVHGGGWAVGSKEARRGMLAQFAEKGFFVVSMNYTLRPESRGYQQVAEIFQCVNFAFSKACKYNFQKGEVFLCGDSAGGHLISLAGVCKNNEFLRKESGISFNDDFKIMGIAPICGVFNFKSVLSCKFKDMKKFLWAYSHGKLRKFLKSEESFNHSPINFAKDFPPCYIVMGEADKLKSQSLELVSALAEEGGKFRLFIGKGKGGFHVFPAMFTTDLSKKCISGICEFFEGR